MWRPGCVMVNEPGVYGLLSTTDEPPTRLLVTDDRARDSLGDLLADAREGSSASSPRPPVHRARRGRWGVEAVAGHGDDAPRSASCCRVRRCRPDWRCGRYGGAIRTRRMACRSRRRSPSPRGGWSREQDAPKSLAAFLRTLPTTVKLFAALDGDRVVRATSGSGTFGDQASVMFVNTDPALAQARRRPSDDVRRLELCKGRRREAGVPRRDRSGHRDLRAARIRCRRPDDAVLPGRMTSGYPRLRSRCL